MIKEQLLCKNWLNPKSIKKKEVLSRLENMRCEERIERISFINSYRRYRRHNSDQLRNMDNNRYLFRIWNYIRHEGVEEEEEEEDIRQRIRWKEINSEEISLGQPALGITENYCIYDTKNSI